MKDMDKIKILIVSCSMNVGGIENQLMHLLRHADRTRFQIEYTTTVDQPFYEEEIKSLGSRCIRLPKTEGRHFVRYCRALYRVLKEGQYDIVHSHELFHSGMVLMTAYFAGVRGRIVHAHSNPSDYGENDSRFLRTLYNTFMRILILLFATDYCACSTAAAACLYGKGTLKKKNYHLIFNSVDTSRFVSCRRKKQEGPFSRDGWVNVLQVGRFDSVKNQLFTADIARELKKAGSRIRILMAGNDGNTYEKQVLDKVREYGLEQHMVLLGVRKDIDALAAASSAFLLPSLYEGMPLSLIEAQAAGLPCLAADTFSHEVDFGLGLIRWMDLELGAGKWAETLSQMILWSRPDEERVIRAIAEHGFDARIFCRKLCGLYETVYKRYI